MQKDNLIYGIIAITIILFCLSLYTLITYYGDLNSEVEHQWAYLEPPREKMLGSTELKSTHNWLIIVNFSSKGAFIINEPLDIVVDFEIFNESYFDDVKEHNILFGFPDSKRYPNEYTDEGLQVEGGGISSGIPGKHFSWEGDITYKKPGEYGIEIQIFDDKGIIIRDYEYEKVIWISSSDLRQQSGHNTIILILTFIIIWLASIGVLTNIYFKSNDRDNGNQSNRANRRKKPINRKK